MTDISISDLGKVRRNNLPGDRTRSEGSTERISTEGAVAPSDVSSLDDMTMSESGTSSIEGIGTSGSPSSEAATEHSAAETSSCSPALTTEDEVEDEETKRLGNWPIAKDGVK